MPTAMVTWAWLNGDVERDVHETGRALSHEEWNCGKRLFFNDWITPYNNIREVLHDMTHNIFPDEAATSLRRNSDGTVRRVNRWTGSTCAVSMTSKRRLWHERRLPTSGL